MLLWKDSYSHIPTRTLEHDDRPWLSWPRPSGGFLDLGYVAHCRRVVRGGLSNRLTDAETVCSPTYWYPKVMKAMESTFELAPHGHITQKVPKVTCTYTPSIR